MAVDKLVDSAKLNAALNYEANKIITKGGGTAPLAFDLENEKGFGDYVDAIPSGGGETIYFERHGIMYTENMVIPEKDSGDTTIHPRYVREQFQAATHLKKYIQQYGTPSLDSDYGLFRDCTALEEVWVARATFGSYSFSLCPALKKITLGRVGLAVTSVQSGMFNNVYMTHIETITVYVNASDLSGVPTAVKDRIVPTNSHGAVITYRNYESGDVIATVTVP